jgi:hypothetical protein
LFDAIKPGLIPNRAVRRKIIANKPVRAFDTTVMELTQAQIVKSLSKFK